MKQYSIYALILFCGLSFFYVLNFYKNNVKIQNIQQPIHRNYLEKLKDDLSAFNQVIQDNQNNQDDQNNVLPFVDFDALIDAIDQETWEDDLIRFR